MVKRILSIAASLLLLLNFAWFNAQEVQAYTLNGCKWTGTKPTVKYRKVMVVTSRYWTATKAGAGR